MSESAPSNEKLPNRRAFLKGLVLGAAGAFGASPEEADAETNERTERIDKLNKILKDFGVPGLTLGEPQNLVRGFYDQFGLYIGKKYIDDAHAKGYGGTTFTHNGFIKRVTEILEDNNIEFTEVKIEEVDERIEVEPDAQKIIDDWGGSFDFKKCELDLKGTKKIYWNDSIEKIRIVKIAENMILITAKGADGKITSITCLNKEITDESSL